MAELIKVNIDGKDIEVKPGTLIIEAAKKLGIEIPTFCYDDRLKSVGSCRMCLVEVEKAPKLVASCATPVGPGMVINTSSEKVIKARKAVLEFMLLNHPLDCPTCDKGGECPLQNQTFKYGNTTSRFTEDKIRKQDEPNQKFDDVKLGPEIWMNKNRCIVCFKCVRINRDLAGGADLGIFERGVSAKVDIPSEIRYCNEFSGNTVEFCPVGALMSDSFRYKIRNWLLDKTDSVSWLCPDGSNMLVEHNQGRIYRHSSRRNDNVEEGFLCDKDRYGFDITSHPDRLKLPMADDKGALNKINYEEALAIAVHWLSEVSGESSALLLDTTLTNEEAFYVSEYYRTKLPGSSIAVTSELALDGDFPVNSLGLSVTIPELENADMVLITGCDLASEHPILGLRIKKLIQKGVPIYFVNSRKMHLGRFEVFDINAEYGKEYETIEKIIALKNGDSSIDIDESIKDKLKTDIEKSQNIHILAGYDLLANANRRKYLQSINKLNDSIKAKLSILTTETNYLGVKLCGQTNSTLDDIIRKIESGKIKTLCIAGGDPVNVYPNRKRIISAFKKLDYLIYWGAFINSTSKLAALVFPSVLPTENAGSYLNIERRLQFMKKPYALNKGIVSLIKLVTDLKNDSGGDMCYSAPEVFARMTESINEFKGLRYGLSEGHVFSHSEYNGADSETEITEIKPPADFPYMLSFSRSVFYGASGITAKSQTLQKLTPSQKLIISNTDAKKENLEDGMQVLLETAAGKGEFVLSVSSEINPRELVLFGYSEDKPPCEFMAGFNKPVYAKINRK